MTALANMSKFSFVVFIALCLMLVGVAQLPWKIDPKAGELGTTIESRNGLAAYELDAGDTIYYEYEASDPCWFIITTDPLNPETGERLNLSGTGSTGSFECPVDGRYVLQIAFLDIPEMDLATVDYESYALDDSGRTTMTAKPIVLAALTTLLAFMVSIAGRPARKARLDRKQGITQSYWQYFASRISNWITIVAGATILVAATAIELADPTTEVSEFMTDWPLSIGSLGIIYGLMIGIAISWPDYKARTFMTANKTT